MPFPQISIDWNKIMQSMNIIWDTLALKLNKDFSNIEGDVDFVIETRANEDGSWYRIYKSGWLEQGGIITVSKDNETIVTNFLKPFKNDKNIYFNRSGEWKSASTAVNSIVGYNVLTTTSVTIVCRGPAYQPEFRWYACGEGA